MQMFIQKRKVELGAGMVMGKYGERSTKSKSFFRMKNFIQEYYTLLTFFSIDIASVSEAIS